MSKLLIKKGDQVLVGAGKDKGKTGKVIYVDKKSLRVAVEGLNVYKKNVKPSKKYPQGGIIDINAPMAISNLTLVCGSCKKATRVGLKNSGKDKRRICKKCSEVIQ
jgi:large subunit ribosomal protein L24